MAASMLRMIVLAIAADAFTTATPNTPTILSSTTRSLVTTQESPISTDTLINTVLESVVSDASNTSVTTAPANAFDSNSASTLMSSGQDVNSSTRYGNTTSSTGSVSNRATSDLAAQSGYTTSSSPADVSTSKSTTDKVDTLNENTGQLSAGNSSGLVGSVLPIVFGSLACVGVLAMAVTHKKKRDGKKVNVSNRFSSACEYNGAGFEDQTHDSVLEDESALDAIKKPDRTRNVVDSASIDSFTSTNSLVRATSPFGSSTRSVRVSSPVPNSHGNSEANMEFPGACTRGEGSEVVLTFNEVRANSSHIASQVQL